MRSFTIRRQAAVAALGVAACMSWQARGAVITVPPAEGERPAHPPMGVNLEYVLDYARSEMFVDCIKSARAFGSAKAPWDEKAPVDKDGWPTGDAGTVVMADVPVPPGAYLFTCTGHCRLGVLSAGTSVQGQGYDRASNTTTGIINVGQNANQLFINFTGTQGAAGGGVKNIRLYRPGYRPAGGVGAPKEEIFTKEFLHAIEPFQALRLMDFTRTNTNDAVEWADRTKPTDALQSGKRGAAWEYGIALGNTAKKDLWINVPVKASDDYVRQLAKLLKEKLDPDRVVYVEYSNEVWNSLFPQFGANFDAAKAEVAREGDSSLLSDHGKDNNPYYWAWKRVAQRLIQIEQIFKEVWGAEAINTRIRPVLASQSANAFMLQMQMDFIAKNYGHPAGLIYGVAGAPYLGLSQKFSNDDSLTVDQIFKEGVPDQMKWVKEVTTNYQVIARYYRVHNLCYEGGMGIEGEHSVDAKIAANRDPRIGGAIKNYFDQWYGLGGDLFMYFNLAGPYGKYGNWGLTEDIRKATAKTQAVDEVIAGALPPVRVGTALPAEGGGAATIDATAADAKEGGSVGKSSDGTFLQWTKDGNWFEYLLLVKQAGVYALTVQTGATNDAGRLDLSLSDTPLGTVNVPNSGGVTTWGSTQPVLVRLSPGQLVLRVKVAKEGMNLRSIRIEKRGEDGGG
ncbi:MAG TPA: carbohydrate-binding protein [Phycisphaerae bacterium]|nr:carbohydrate-binding protein [Phycisphaerae bacterium]